ncbi:hypothetical protein [Natrialba asiatica]|uniref:Uncharacterized protein n=1 Tax=Natrialba asiatica (strain ATCC 700177 / DSM 12278 / JCM 9576 / FERM P-10747 / NBRC 102637 / 172P1) TaxID=29540 RepID=M0AWC7_NATA1|nr:hypothetical protein [Natrialba asiatica]ELZ01704.1 hypothetical protein C481_09297 [Natrialba asiatica DSM 12278]
MLTPTPGALPPDIGTALAALFLLFGVPALIFGFIFLYTGYVRYDAEQYLAELDATEDTDTTPSSDRAHTSSQSRSQSRSRSEDTESPQTDGE